MSIVVGRRRGDSDGNGSSISVDCKVGAREVREGVHCHDIPTYLYMCVCGGVGGGETG